MQNEAAQVSTSETDRKRNRPAREHALMSAAGKLFAAHGYETTTTRQIAAQAGCAEGLIHRYFNGKAGLLLAIVESRVTQAVCDLNEGLPIAASLEDEILQLVDWEINHMWEDREFLSIVVPRALLDPELGEVINEIGLRRRSKAIAARLRSVDESSLTEEEVEALAQLVPVLGFMFGFMRPVVLRQDRDRARAMAMRIARLAARKRTTNFQALDERGLLSHL